MLLVLKDTIFFYYDFSLNFSIIKDSILFRIFFIINFANIKIQCKNTKDLKWSEIVLK